MTERELSTKLREDARRIGLCDQWYAEWNDDTPMQDLIDKYKRGIDFAFKHRYPTYNFIREHFPQQLLRDNGILLNDTRSYPVRDADTRRLTPIRDYVLLGNSYITIRYSFRRYASNVWARDNSKVTANVKYGAFLLVHLFDNATANITTDLVSRVKVIRHSHGTSVTRNGDVVVSNEFNYLI